VAHSGHIEVIQQRLEEPPPGFGPHVRTAPTHSDPGFHERAQQPGPDRALVVRPIALAAATLIPRSVALRAGCQRAPPARGPELPLDGVADLPGPLGRPGGV